MRFIHKINMKVAFHLKVKNDKGIYTPNSFQFISALLYLPRLENIVIFVMQRHIYIYIYIYFLLLYIIYFIVIYIKR